MLRTRGASCFGSHTFAGGRTAKLDSSGRKQLSYWEKLRKIEETYDGSAEMKMCAEAYWDEITRPGIKKRSSNRPDQIIPPPIMHFLHATVRNIIMFGYSVFRRLALSNEYVVPSGAEMSVRFDCETEKWVADAGATIDEALWTVIVVSPPTERGPVSFGEAAMPEIERLMAMRERAAKRDRFNSAPAVYATVDNAAMSKETGVTALPHASMAANESYETLIQRRAEILRAAKAASDTMNNERRGFGRVGSGVVPADTPTHLEYYVADGMPGP